jgi:hypothetical protein
LLHDAAHKVCAQRLWQAFLGWRHLILTPWLHLAIYEADFGWGKPKYVDSVMAPCDGIVVIVEAQYFERVTIGLPMALMYLLP